MNNQPEDVLVQIAHKDFDRDNAQRLKDKLESYGGNRLRCELLREEPDKKEWVESLKNTLRDADLLLFLATSPGTRWDWSIYQAGLSDGSKSDEKRRRPVLLCSKVGDIPAALAKTAVVFRADSEQIRDFLKQFFGATNLTGIKVPLSQRFSTKEDEIKSAAEKICSWFSKKPNVNRPSYECNYLIITVQDPKKLQQNSIPADAIIESNAGSLSMFGVKPKSQGGNWTWGELEKRIDSDDNSAWVRNLALAMLNAHNKFSIDPARAIFRSNGELYKPILYQTEEAPDGAKRFHVLFPEEVAEGYTVAPTEALTTLLTASTLGARLQWSVCEYYLGQLYRYDDEEELKSLCREVKAVYANIEKDADVRREGEARLRRNEDRLRDAFNAEDAKVVQKNMVAQLSHKAILMNADQQCDKKFLEDAIEKLSRLNAWMLVTVAERYAELLREQLGDLLEGS